MTHPAYRAIRMAPPAWPIPGKEPSPVPKAEFERPEDLPRAARFTRDDLLTAQVILEESKVGGRFEDVMDLAAALKSCATTVHRVAENACNGYRNDGDEDRDNRREARAIAKAEAWLKPHGIELRTGGDPRGACFYLKTPKSGRHNTWGGAESGWAVT